jgi:hypothetical protein
MAQVLRVSLSQLLPAQSRGVYRTRPHWGRENSQIDASVATIKCRLGWLRIPSVYLHRPTPESQLLRLSRTHALCIDCKVKGTGQGAGHDRLPRAVGVGDTGTPVSTVKRACTVLAAVPRRRSAQSCSGSWVIVSARALFIVIATRPPSSTTTASASAEEPQALPPAPRRSSWRPPANRPPEPGAELGVRVHSAPGRGISSVTHEAGRSPRYPAGSR